MAWMENVRNLVSGSGSGSGAASSSGGGASKSTDFKELIKLLNTLGFALIHEVVSPVDYYCPQSRDRVYMFAFQISADPIDQLAEDYCMPGWMKDVSLFLHACRSAEPIPLYKFLVPSTHDWIQENINEQLQCREKESARSQGSHINKAPAKGTEYEVDHLEAFQENGWTWPPDLEHVSNEEVAAATVHMPRRKREIVYFHKRRYNDMHMPDGGDHHFIVDVNLNLKWSQGARLLGVSPCIVSTSRMYMFPQMRDMLGQEALSLQGFPMREFRRPFELCISTHTRVMRAQARRYLLCFVCLPH